MANTFEWFQSAVINIQSNEDKYNKLSDFKIAIAELKSTKLKLIANNLQLNIFFDCLNSSVREEVEITCDILDALLSSLEANNVLEQYNKSIQRALCHPTTTVKKMIIKQLQRVVSDIKLLTTFAPDAQIPQEVVICVGNEDMSLSNCAIKFLVELGQTLDGINILYSRSMISALKNVMVQNDIFRFRIYEIVTAVSESSEAGLEASCECGLLPQLLLELQDDNVLIQLNALELLTKLALTQHGITYLEEQGVIRSLADNLISGSDDPLASVLQPGYIKFFGNMAQSRPQQMITQYSHMAMALFETLDTPDVVLLGVVMETIGYIATSVEGKFSLQSLGDTMPSAMRKFGSLMNNLPSEGRVRVLNTIANIVELKVADQNEETLSLVRSWFHQLGPEPMYSIMIICRQPFPELKLAALQVVQSVAEQPWGQQAINDTAGLLELLLNRSMETTKVCKDAKHRVVETLAMSPAAERIFSSETLAQLRDFSKEGPCFVRSATEVAIEGAS